MGFLRLKRRVRTPTTLQFEAAECGAAALSMILGWYGRRVPLETLRHQCGVSRDGAKASSLLKAARHYGLKAKGLKAEPADLAGLTLPAIAFVNFGHFVVVEEMHADGVRLNDPAEGRRTVGAEEFDAMFTGVVLVFTCTDDFVRSDERPSLLGALLARTRGARAATIFAVLASLGLVLPGFALPALSKVFVDYVLVREFSDWLAPLLIGLALTAVFRFALLELRNWALLRAETLLSVNGAKELLRHILRLPIAFFGTRHAGEIADRLDLSDDLADLLTGQIAHVALNLLAAMFFALLMFAYDAVIAAAVLALSALNLLAVVATARFNADVHRKLSVDRGKLAGVALSGLRDVESLKAVGAEDSFFTRWAGLHGAIVERSQSIGRRLAWLRAASPFFTALTTATVLGLGGLGIINGTMSVGTLVALQTLAASLSAPIIALAGLGTRLQEVRSYTERTDDVLHQPEEIGLSSDDAVTSLPKGRLSLRDVSFGYLPLEAPLIEELSLEIPEGGSVALVGASGSGKSTVGRLLAGLYAPAQGSVLIDEQPIVAWPRAARAATVAYVDQEIVLFDGTIRDNLSLWDETLPDAQVVAAARDAVVHDVVVNRAGGYDADVDEYGRNFSGGQRQRLEIARALAVNPRILILDEATSALDASTEDAIMRNLKARGITMVVIAHRLSTVRDCDQIVVLERGTVVERGSHDELIDLSGHYARLVEA